MKTFLDLSIEKHPEGDWNLKQDIGACDETGCHWVILAPEQLDTLARMADYIPITDVKSACERLKDRLYLLAGMVEAHTRQGDPLRAAVAAIVPEYVSVSAMQRTPPVAPETVPLMASATIPPASPPMDLFSDIAGEVQSNE